MTKPRVGRREFLRDIAGFRRRDFDTPPDLQRAGAGANCGPELKFAVIGINHSHINSQVDAVLRGGGELVSVYREGAGPASTPSSSGSRKRSGRAARTRSSRTSRIQLVLSSGDPGRARAARHPRDEARQGLHVRQAGHHDARPARRGAQGAGGDQADLLDHVQRAAREPRDRQGGRAREGRRDRQVIQTIGLGPAPDQPGVSAGMVLGQGAVRRHPLRHRLAPGGPVPVLHRLDAGRRRLVAGRERPPSRSAEVRGFRRRHAARRPRCRLHSRRLVHARRPLDMGRRPADDPRHRRLHRDPQERRHRRTPGREPPVPRGQQGDALHRLQGCRAAVRRRSSSPMSSTARKRRCRRRIVSLRRS